MESPHRVIVAGAGVAGLEAVLTLHALMGDRVSITLIEPSTELALEADSVELPFARPGGGHYDLGVICEDHGALLRSDALERVVDWPRSVVTRDGAELPFDSLVVAVGARPTPVFGGAAVTFRGTRDAEVVHGLIQDLEGGYVRRIAFVIPPGVTWPLPLYELALMTAERADSMCLGEVEISVVTPESRPLDVFGDEAAKAVTGALRDAGVRLVPETQVADVRAGALLDADGTELLRAERVVALPTLTGPRISGLPADERGFIPSDRFTRVEGMTGVYAVGDGSAHPIKQGGVGAQQAAIAAQHIAMRAGIDVEPTEFHPVMRAKLLTGGRELYLRRRTPEDPGVAVDRELWWPPAKVVASHLAAYLDRLDHGERGPAEAPAVQVVHGLGDPTGGIELLG